MRPIHLKDGFVRTYEYIKAKSLAGLFRCAPGEAGLGRGGLVPLQAPGVYKRLSLVFAVGAPRPLCDVAQRSLKLVRTHVTLKPEFSIVVACHAPRRDGKVSIRPMHGLVVTSKCSRSA